MKPYYEDSAVTIYHGDCRDIIPLLGNFDLALTDPPYGVNIGSVSKAKYESFEDTEANVLNVVNEIMPVLRLKCRRVVLTPGSSESAEKNGHPCPKPIGQWNWLLTRSSLEGESILDPFMGSGTTLQSAKYHARKATGIEIEEKYCEIAAKRMAQEVFAF